MAKPGLSAFEFPTPGNRPNYYGAVDPNTGRYKDAETRRYLSDETSVAAMAYVEAALAHTYADFGKCRREVALEIEHASQEISAQEAEDREKGRGDYESIPTFHDIVALVNAISDRVSEEARPWVHAASTSYDIISTARSWQFKETVNGLIVPRVVSLGDALAELTERHADTAQVGRTHGQHAVPITFGFATSRYLGRLGESLVNTRDRANELQGKFSGAVGGYNASSLINDDPRAFERAFLDKLGLEPCTHSTQIVPAENMTNLLYALTVNSGVMAQIGEDMRNLQRTEIAEVGENFGDTQKGSSAMAQKKNPISFENVAGSHRQVLAQLFNAMQNLTSDHQRDLRDSVAMRYYGAIPAIVARSAKTLTRALSKLDVNPSNMQRNLYLTNGAIASEALQTVLRDRGRADAYAVAKRIVETAQLAGISLGDAVAQDGDIGPILGVIPAHQRDAIVHPETNYLGLTEEEAKRHVSQWQEIRQQLAA
jgi:adenylosuccinate lyase